MAADYDKLGLDSNLYRKDASSSARLTAADLEVLFADSEFFSAKIGSMSIESLQGGTLKQGESIILSDGSTRRGIIGFIGEIT